MVGIGNLGSAILMYKDFLKQSYKIVAAFDLEPVKVIGHISEKIGKPIEILHIDRLKEVVKARNVEIGIITTPPSGGAEGGEPLRRGRRERDHEFRPHPNPGAVARGAPECLLHGGP